MAKKTTEPMDDCISVLREFTGKENLGLRELAEEGDVSPTVARRKQEILEAALNVFSKKGFDGSRTKEIAVEAGVSEATVFKYFPTKQTLFASLIRPVIETIAKPICLAPVVKIIDDAGSAGLEKTLLLLIKDRLRIFEKNERLFRTLILELGRQEDIQAVVGQQVYPLIARQLRRLYDAGRARGEIGNHIDEITFSRGVLGMIIGNLLLIKGVPAIFGKRDAESDMESAVRLFVHGLRGPDAAR